MSLMDVSPVWLQEEMGYDPRERDFRRDFYHDDISRKMQTLRTKAVKNEKRDDHRHVGETITELKFWLSEATELMSLMNWELAAAKRLTRHLTGMEDTRLSRTAVPSHQPSNSGNGKKPKRTVVCRRCETSGHHWMDCRRVSCSCGTWHTRYSLPLPTCVRGARICMRDTGHRKATTNCWLTRS